MFCFLFQLFDFWNNGTWKMATQFKYKRKSLENIALKNVMIVSPSFTKTTAESASAYWISTQRNNMIWNNGTWKMATQFKYKRKSLENIALKNVMIVSPSFTKTTSAFQCDTCVRSKYVTW